VQVDVYLAYQGTERCFYSYTYTYNESEKENMTWDNKEEMKGMNTACQIINQQISPMLMGRDLYLLKKLESALTNLKNKSEQQGVTVGSNVISSVSNALFYGCAKAMDN
jgi:enolase